MNQDPILQKAMTKWENMSHDASFRRANVAREKVLLDELAKLAHAEQKGRQEDFEEGFKKGFEEGMKDGKMQIIQAVYRNGMPVEDIAKFTGLRMADIQELLRS